MSANIRLKSFIDRVLRLKEEQDTLAADIREVYAEAKGEGYDKTAMGEVVSYLRKIEKKGKNEVDERGALFDLYLNAYENGIGTTVATHAHAPDASQPATAQGRGAGQGLAGTPINFDAETGELLDEHESPAGMASGAGHTSGLRNPADTENGHVDRSAGARPSGQDFGAEPRSVERGVEIEHVDELTSLAAREGDKTLHPITENGLAEPACAQDAEAANIKSAPITLPPDPRPSQADGGQPGLTAETLKALLSYDPVSGQFSWLESGTGRRPNSVAGTKSIEGYIQISIGGAVYRAHRLAWLYMTGSWPSDQIDHINGIKDDNSFANLREATNAENGHNRGPQKNCASGRRGVYWQEAARKWHVSLQHNGKRHYVGLFTDLDEATRAYDAASLEMHGEFARPNDASGASATLSSDSEAA